MSEGREPDGRQPVRATAALKSALETAVPRAAGYLTEEAGRDFVEARHEMVFPRRAGFRVRDERQAGDIFARAVLASVLLDVADLDDELRPRWTEIAGREAEYVASARLADRDGGWSYFPELPELPPDLDSLSAAMSLFSRIARHHLSLCDEPVGWALAEQRDDGSIPTWILAPTNTRAQNRLMQRGIRRFWGHGIDVEVCARFFRALLRADAARFAETVSRGAEFVVSRQHPSGVWSATWYWGEVYGTGLCAGLLRELATAGPSVDRAVAAMRGLQRDDGGWGVWESVPLDTAVALWEILQDGATGRTDRLCGAVRFLVDQQAPDGSWPATPWIKMDVGRATGRTIHTLTYQSRTVTTAFALRSLMLARRHLAASIGSSTVLVNPGFR